MLNTKWDIEKMIKDFKDFKETPEGWNIGNMIDIEEMTNKEKKGILDFVIEEMIKDSVK